MTQRSRQGWRFPGGSAPALIVGIAAALVAAPTVSANPALAANLRKSPIPSRAAGATTVADQLAIRRFGVQPAAPTSYVGTGFVLPRYRYGGHYGSPPHGHGGYGDLPPRYDGDPRPDNWNPDHYDDEKPYDYPGHGHSRGGRHHRGGYGTGVRVYGSGFNTVYYYNSSPYYGYDNGWWDPFPYGIDGRLVSGIQPGSQLAMPAPSTAPGGQASTPPEPPTPLETARWSISDLDYEWATEAYRAHLDDHPDDFQAMAELVVALAGTGRLDDAAAMVRMAYERDPGLANEPVNERISLRKSELRKLVTRAVRFAHDRDSASAWLLVSVLMQAEDRDSVGLRMLDRSIKRGLPRNVADPLAAALR